MKRVFHVRSTIRAAGTFLLAAALLLALWGCEIPMPGFADFDVSGYIEALLDSSYLNKNEELMAISGVTAETAAANNESTLENAAVRFCNIHQVAPDDEQIARLKAVMGRAYAASRYTVVDEKRTATGFDVEVQIYSVNNFSNCIADIERLRDEAQTEASQAVIEGEMPDVNTLFAEKVTAYCEQALSSLSYDTGVRVVTLNILQTEQGELQLDLNQLDVIDQTVVLLTQG